MAVLLALGTNLTNQDESTLGTWNPPPELFVHSNQVLPPEQDLPEKPIKGLVGVSGGEIWKTYGEGRRSLLGRALSL